jgi:hypothetical protein
MDSLDEITERYLKFLCDNEIIKEPITESNYPAVFMTLCERLYKPELIEFMTSALKSQYK